MHSPRRLPLPLPADVRPYRSSVPIRAGAVLGALFVVLLVLVSAEWAPLLTLDGRVADGLHPAATGHRGWTHAMRLLSDWLWDPWTMRAALAVTALWLVRRREGVLAAWIAVTSLLGTALQQGLKAAVGRDRPSWADPVAMAHYQAFPSGHALSATVACGLLVWLLWLHGAGVRWVRGALVAAVVSVVGVGFTRVYLGVHWLSDVVGGWLLGGALVALSVGAYAAVAGRGGAGRPA
ncbi:membrane protein [Streptomyces albireticuli]|uniref:Membrane protein n=1 Tax=Streptomyces albireticuli TaxID=1940 RepID=A0A1Z2KWL7_9ACTN|nr:phosphatase PAP2 family protein [Streptomyces albireticuli]ARZ66361.1 membrane protein [Streptomyces albireticuli]